MTEPRTRAKIFFVALLCPLLSAADFGDAAQDQMSLLQVDRQIVNRHGNERTEPSWGRNSWGRDAREKTAGKLVAKTQAAVTAVVKKMTDALKAVNKLVENEGPEDGDPPQLTESTPGAEKAIASKVEGHAEKDGEKLAKQVNKDVDKLESQAAKDGAKEAEGKDETGKKKKQEDRDAKKEDAQGEKDAEQDVKQEKDVKGAEKQIAGNTDEVAKDVKSMVEVDLKDKGSFERGEAGLELAGADKDTDKKKTEKAMKNKEKHELKVDGAAEGLQMQKAESGGGIGDASSLISAGGVEAAFSTNADKVRQQIEKTVKSRIAFTKEQHKLRKVAQQMAHKSVTRSTRAQAKYQRKAKKLVGDAQKTRSNAQKKAAAKIQTAQRTAADTAKKADQVEQAAQMGRRVGAIEGADIAQQSWSDYQNGIAKKKAMQAARARKRESRKQDRAQMRQAKSETNMYKRMDKRTVLQARQERRAAAVQARQYARQMAESIEGPEGLKNRLTDVAADWSIQHYDRQTASNEKRIAAALKGTLPYELQ